MNREQTLDLRFPGHLFSPEDFQTFVECDGFLEEWGELGLGEDDLYYLQVAIMVEPKAFRAVRGSGGLRVGRYRPPGWSQERTLFVRYVWFRKHNAVVLVTAYDEEVPTPGEEECKEIRKFIAEENWILGRRSMGFRDSSRHSQEGG